MSKFTSKSVFKDFSKKLDKFIKIKEPTLNGKLVKSDLINFVSTLNDDEKVELCAEIDKVLSKDILFNEVKFVNFKLQNNRSYVSVFYRMAKFELGIEMRNIKKEQQLKQNTEYEKMTEKELLIELIKMFKLTFNYE